MAGQIHAVAIDPRAAGGAGAALRIRGLKKAFVDVQAVDGIDLEVAKGECFGLLGPNGAGKTTTIEICEGLTTADEGTVELLRLNWIRSADELRQRIGIQLQETQFPDKLTVEEALRLFRSFYRRGITVDESIKISQLEEKRRSRVGGLSGGQKQRLAMATAMVGDPELLFLDEPTTGLDPQARRHLWDLVEELKREGRTIILTTHYMEEAERLCDRVAIVDHGRVIALGTNAELVHNAFASRSQVEAHFAGPSDGVAAWVAQRGGRLVDSTAQFTVERPTEIAGLLDGAAKAGLEVVDVSLHRPNLESVFLHLTGRELRD